MIAVKVGEVREAFVCLARVADVKLPAKAAWRVARLLGKLRKITITYEEVLLKILVDAGGIKNDRGVTLPVPTEVEGDEPGVYEEKMAAYMLLSADINDQLKAVNEEDVDIDYDPMPMELFGTDAQFTPNDFLVLEKFITE